MPGTPPLLPFEVSSATYFRPECSHPQLFQTEYKRSNRTKGLKILRCFPHCCPEHIDRSYCGTSLSVRIELSTCPSAASKEPPKCENVAVFARFEAVSDVSLRPSECVEVDTMVAGTQSEDNLEGQWVAGTRDRPSGLVTTLRAPEMPSVDHISLVFHLNGKPFSRWYYDWESGANKAQRLMKHVLKSYIVEHCAVDANDNFVSLTSQQACKQLYRVLHVVKSPEFTVISYRRAPSDPYQTALLPSHSMSGDDILAYEGTQLSYASVTVKVEPSLTRAEQAMQDRSLELPHVLSPSTEVPGRNSEAFDLEYSNVVIMPVAKNLALVYSFARWLPVSAYCQIFDKFIEVAQHSVQEAFVEATGELCKLDSLIRLLYEHVQSHKEDMLRWIQDSQQFETLLVVLVQTMQWLISRETRTWIQNYLRQNAQSILNKRTLRVCFAIFIQKLQDRLDKEVFAHTKLRNLENVADEVIAAVYSNSYFRSQRHQVRQILSAQDVVGWAAFVAQMREMYISVSAPARAPRSLAKRKDRRKCDSSHGLPNFIEINWNTEWILDVDEVCWQPSQQDIKAGNGCCGNSDTFAIHGNNDTTTNNDEDLPSVFTIFQLISQVLRLEVVLDIQASTLHLRSTLGVTGPLDCMRLVLDGKERTFSQFPNGVASAVNTGAYGDYIGEMRVEGSNRLVTYLQLFTWSLSDNDSSYNVRMRIECWRSCRLCISGDILATNLRGTLADAEVAFFREMPLWRKQEAVHRAHEANGLKQNLTTGPWKELGNFRLSYMKL
uniref:Uncharacterized protein n=1 Tax=Peronospora matthiolae TaxID=2874970 RepID=A0AAV1U8D9_9STRA